MSEKPKISDEVRAKLREPMPKEAIKKHPTKTFLSTIKAMYVVERLNDVFGLGRWDLETNVIKETNDYVLMSGKLCILDYNVVIPLQYGGHSTTGKNTELADGYKSAITDCLSKCASYLEIGIEVFKGEVSPSGYTTKTPPTKTTTPPSKKSTGNISEAQVKRLHAISGSAGWTKKQVEDFLIMDYGLDSSKDITKDKYDEICGKIEAGKPDEVQDHKPDAMDALREVYKVELARISPDDYNKCFELSKIRDLKYAGVDEISNLISMMKDC